MACKKKFNNLSKGHNFEVDTFVKKRIIFSCGRFILEVTVIFRTYFFKCVRFKVIFKQFLAVRKIALKIKFLVISLYLYKGG